VEKDSWGQSCPETDECFKPIETLSLPVEILRPSYEGIALVVAHQVSGEGGE